MPRTGKGGKREGSSQTAYANRTDLNNRGPQPIATAPGQPYGQAQMQEDAQKAVPMSGVQTPTPAPSAPQIAPQAPMQTIQASPGPGEIPFDHPTNRPDEPIMAGTDAYAQHAKGNPNANLLAALEQAASMPTASSRVKMLAEIARTTLAQ